MDNGSKEFVSIAVISIMLFRVLIWPLLKAMVEGLMVRWDKWRYKNKWDNFGPR